MPHVCLSMSPSFELRQQSASAASGKSVRAASLLVLPCVAPVKSSNVEILSFRGHQMVPHVLCLVRLCRALTPFTCILNVSRQHVREATDVSKLALRHIVKGLEDYAGSLQYLELEFNYDKPHIGGMSSSPTVQTLCVGDLRDFHALRGLTTSQQAHVGLISMYPQGTSRPGQ